MKKNAGLKTVAAVTGLSYLGYRGIKSRVQDARKTVVSNPRKYSGHLHSNVMAGKIQPEALNQRESAMVSAISQTKTASEKAKYILSFKTEFEKIAKIGLLSTALTGVAAAGEYGEARNRHSNFANERLGEHFRRPIPVRSTGSNFKGTRQAFAKRGFY